MKTGADILMEMIYYSMLAVALCSEFYVLRSYFLVCWLKNKEKASAPHMQMAVKGGQC